MRRPILLSPMLRGILMLCLSALALPGQNSSYRPGTTDPAGNPGNFTLFRDEQLFLIGPGTANNRWPTATATFDGNLIPTGTVSSLPWSSSLPWGPLFVQAVAGRIVHPDKDDILIAQRSESDPTKLAVRFRDGSGETLLGNLPERIPGWADFFATSEGDLDRLYDSQGNYHDEVVTAWMQEQNDPTRACDSYVPHNTIMVPHVAVLNYNNGVNPSSVELNLSDYSGGQFYFVCTEELAGRNSYNDVFTGKVSSITIQPVDNIIATAVGDFDGDGYNEVALAYMRGGLGTAMNIVIFRYQNDGTNASLTPVNAFQIYRPDRSMVGTLTLAAGNFDGSGVDQLLVGSAFWWGTPGADGGDYVNTTLQTQPVLFLLKGGQVSGSITGGASSGTDNAQTQFTVSLGSGAYVPRTVTIAGATGSWAPINGTWPVTPTPNGFSLALDSSTFGSFIGQTVQFTAAAALTQTDSLEMDTFPGLPNFSPGAIRIDYDDRYSRIRVQALPGLFHYDPNHGFDYRRRQIAVAWDAKPAFSVNQLGNQNGDPHLAIIQVTTDDKLTTAAVANGLLGSFQGFQTLQLAAGAFLGDNNTNDPTWSIFVGASEAASQAQPFTVGEVNAMMKVSPDPTDPSKLQLSGVCSGRARDPEYGKSAVFAPYCDIWGADATIDFLDYRDLRLPAIAADLNGNSLRLGAPVHFELTNPGKADFILEQPPQHAAWLDEGKGPSVVTINRYTSFNTSMQDSQKTAYKSKNTSHLDWTVGGSEKVTAQQTTSEGAQVSVLGEDLEGSTSQKYSLSFKVAYDYEDVSSNYGSNYDSYTVGQNAETGQDDSLIVESQILDLWRYRIFGQGTSTGSSSHPNMFYEIVLPGPSLLSKPGGRDVDWYQPVHEVGNILSYPGRTDACNPSDLGPITIPSIPDITNKAIPLISCSQQFYNGNSSSTSLAFDHQTGKGGSTDYTHKLHADLDFTFTYKAKEAVGGFSSKTSITSDTDVHGGADWGALTTSDSSTTDATGITLNSPQGDSNHAYPYYPIFYNTSDGGLKAAYGVGDITSSGAGGAFWTDNYSSAPDPALNLPNRFKATYSPEGIVNGWEPETTIVRKRMKGFVVRRPNPNPVTGYYPLQGSNPSDGDMVLLEARVYNYSISSTPTGPITVQFSVIPYDGGTNNEICPNIPTTGKGGRVCPASARTIVGTGSSSPTGGQLTISLNARENKKVYLKWNTQGFGPSSAGVNEYRVYVDLVPNPRGPAELYPPEPPCAAIPCEDNFSNQYTVDPGQNNEGWSLISVQKRSLGGPLGGSNSGETTRGTLGAGSASGNAAQQAGLAEEQERSRKPKPLEAFLFQPLHLRITAFSDAISSIHGQVSIFDGQPSQRRAHTIAIKTLHGVTPSGSSSWFTWTPTKKGLHHFYAVAQTVNGTTPLGDVVIRVRRLPGDLNDDGRVDRHDLNMLSRDLGKTAAESACGEECDFDGDGQITQKDADLMTRLCDSQDCAFAKTEYVGGASSPLEPNMRATRNSDDAAIAGYKASNPDDAEAVDSEPAQIGVSALYTTELQRKQGMRNIKYYYKGKPVTAGPLAQGAEAAAKVRNTSNQ